MSQWVALSIGQKPRTQQFNKEIADTIRRHWPGYLNAPAASITPAQITDFAQRVSHYCPSRWNAIVTALRFATPGASLLKRRPLRIRQFTPPAPALFSALLEELDRRPQSHAGLIVRFLSLTGLRTKEARALRWTNVLSDRIEVAADSAKNGVARCVPFLPGLVEVLNRLRALAPDPARGAVLPRGHPRRAIRTACELVGLPRLTPHCFRHLFATRCIESGVDVPTVARWLGHKDGGALLAKIYFHLVDEHSRQMAARVTIAA